MFDLGFALGVKPLDTTKLAGAQAYLTQLQTSIATNMAQQLGEAQSSATSVGQIVTGTISRRLDKITDAVAVKHDKILTNVIGIAENSALLALQMGIDPVLVPDPDYVFPACLTDVPIWCWTQMIYWGGQFGCLFDGPGLQQVADHMQWYTYPEGLPANPPADVSAPDWGVVGFIPNTTEPIPEICQGWETNPYRTICGPSSIQPCDVGELEVIPGVCLADVPYFCLNQLLHALGLTTEGGVYEFVAPALNWYSYPSGQLIQAAPSDISVWWTGFGLIPGSAIDPTTVAAIWIGPKYEQLVGGLCDIPTYPPPTIPPTVPPTEPPVPPVVPFHNPDPGENCPVQCAPQPVNLGFDPADGLPPLEVAGQLVLDCSQFQLLSVGSEQWCGALDAIMAAFGSVGTTIASAVLPFDIAEFCSNDFDPAAWQAKQREPVDWSKLIPDFSNPLQVALYPAKIGTTAALQVIKTASANIIGGILRQTGLADADVGQAITDFDFTAITLGMRQKICSVYMQLVKCNPCNPAIVLGLSLFKTVLSFFKHLRGDFVAGWAWPFKAGLKVAFHIPLVIKPLEQVLDYLIEFACPSKIPSEGEIIEMILRQEISEGHGRCLFKLHGFNPDLMLKVVHAKRREWNFKEIIGYTLRRPDLNLDPAFELQKQRYFDKQDVQIAQELFQELPTIHDHLHWLARNVDSFSYVAEFGLWQGFDSPANVAMLLGDLANEPGKSPEQVNDIGNAVNIVNAAQVIPALAERNFWSTFGHDLTSQGVTKRTAFFHYLAHWILPAPEKGAEFAQRLRPGRVAANLAFTIDAYKRTLLEQDVAPTMVDRFISTAYRPVQIRFLRALFENSVIDLTEAIEVLQDQGYSESDAQRLGQSMEVEKRKHRATLCDGYSIQNVFKLYRLRQLAKPDAIDKLLFQGLTLEEANEGLEVLEAEHKAKELDELTADTKVCFFNHEVSEDGARVMLVGGGMEVQIALDKVAGWKRHAGCAVHHARANELLDYWRKGFIQPNEVLRRLVQLNLDDDYISNLMALGYLHLQQDVAKSQSLFAKQQAALAKEIEKQLERQRKKILAGEKITLNLSKAQARAQLVLMKQDAQAQKKAAAKAYTIKRVTDLQQQKITFDQQTVDVKDATLDAIVAAKQQALIDLASTTDKLEKANIHSELLDKLNTLKQQLTDELSPINIQNMRAKAYAGQPLGAVMDVTIATVEKGLAQQVASNITNFAQQDAQLAIEDLQGK